VTIAGRKRAIAHPIGKMRQIRSADGFKRPASAAYCREAMFLARRAPSCFTADSGATRTRSGAVQFRDRPVAIGGVMPGRLRFIYQETDVWRAARLDRKRDMARHVRPARA